MVEMVHTLSKRLTYYHQIMGCGGLTGSAWEDFLSFAAVSSTVKEFILMLPFLRDA